MTTRKRLLRINWFSPLAPLPTDIAHYTMRIVTELVKHADVTLWTDQKEWDPEIEKVAAVRQFDPTRIGDSPSAYLLNRADVNIYNIGNNADFHCGIWQMSRWFPGLIVLHDKNVHELFRGFYLAKNYMPDAYCQAHKELYGEEAEKLARSYTDGSGGDPVGEELVKRYDLCELALEGSLGAISHYEAGAKDLRRKSDVPVSYLPIPFRVDAPVDRSNVWTPSSGRPLEIVQFGYIHTNRRLIESLEVIAKLPQKDQIRMTIFGKIWDQAKLDKALAETGLGDQVTYKGFVAEEELDEALRTADLALNLRNPTMGEASGSQLRIWNLGLASMVTDCGWYADMPEGTALPIDPDNEDAALTETFKAIFAGEVDLGAIGQAGRTHFEETHDTIDFCQALSEELEALPDLHARRCAFIETRRAASATGGIFEAHQMGLGMDTVIRGLESVWGADIVTDEGGD